MPLTTSDIDALCAGLGPAVRDFLAETLKPIITRLVALEKARADDNTALAEAISRKWANDNTNRK